MTLRPNAERFSCNCWALWSSFAHSLSFKIITSTPVIMETPCMYFPHTALTPVDHFHFLSHICYIVLPSFSMKARARMQLRLYVFGKKQIPLLTCKLSCRMAPCHG